MQTVKKTYLWAFLAIFLLGMAGCATYYERNLQFMQAFERGNMPEAISLIGKQKKEATRKNRLLYFLNSGTVHAVAGEYDKSNQFFENAYLTVEDMQKNYAKEALVYLLNAEAADYIGEDHEVLYVHYYKALNFLKLGNREAALVECKRMNIKLDALADKYKSERRFQRDAFVHILMGLIYEMNGDANNAFIAYRNAVEIYEKDYGPFGVSVPEPLKDDVIRTAYLASLGDLGQQFEKKFSRTYQPRKAGEGEVIFFWHNGLGPVKVENNISFTIIPAGGGYVHFVNNELGLSFPFYVGEDKDKRQQLSDLQFFRVAFPKYVERKLVYASAQLKAAGQSQALHPAENMNAIAFKCLDDRFHLEIGKAIGRMALKKAAELALRKQNEGAGFALGVFNMFSEKADTRNWQTMPHTVYYTRMRLAPGAHTLTLETQARQGFQNRNQEYSLNLTPGSTVFLTHHSLDYIP